MIEDACRAHALVVVMKECEDAGWFLNGPARGQSYRHRVESAAAYMIDRIRDALVLPGEVLEQFSTCRGLATKLGCGKSAAWTLMQRFKTLQVFQHRQILRRWQVNRPSRTQDSNPYWWMPTVWRIGERLAKFFVSSTQSGTKLAVSPLGSHYRTRISPKGSGYSSEILSPDPQQDQGFSNGSPSRPVLIKPIEIEHLMHAVDRLNAKLLIEDDRPPTVTEAQEAIGDTEKAIEVIQNLESLDRFDRLQAARKKLEQAQALLELAEWAARLSKRPSRPTPTPS